VNLLLDTHALLWWLAGAPMEARATSRISDPNALVAVSAVSVWEISIKRDLGKVRLEGAIGGHVTNAGFEPLPVSMEHAERAGDLPLHHRDPFDRMLVAQAQTEGLTLVTRDLAFGPYEVAILSC
jgi:PIN domain nuclease of toxin-antitoxin system